MKFSWLCTFGKSADFLYFQFQLFVCTCKVSWLHGVTCFWMNSTEIDMIFEYERNCGFFKAQEWQIQISICAGGKLIAIRNCNLLFLSKVSQDWAVNWKFFWSFLLFLAKKNYSALLSNVKLNNVMSLVELIDSRKCFPYLYSNWHDLFQNSKKVYGYWCDLFQNSKKCTEIYVIFFKSQKSTQKLVWSF